VSVIFFSRNGANKIADVSGALGPVGIEDGPYFFGGETREKLKPAHWVMVVMIQERRSGMLSAFGEWEIR